jgi:hypothetical protein
MRTLIQPAYTLSGFTGAPDTLRAMRDAAQGPQGEKSMLARTVTERIVSGLVPKDYLGEIIAVRNWVAENVRYTNDQLHVEMVKTPERLIKEYLEWGVALGDCDDQATLIATMCLQLGRVVELVVAGFGEPGQYSHVFPRVLEPKSGQWIICDVVAGTNERQMLHRIKTYQLWSLDEAN